VVWKVEMNEETKKKIALVGVGLFLVAMAFFMSVAV
jgi:hypothetical protein